VELNKRLAVVILFFEKAQQTIDCVKSFLPSGVNIYILNNGSSKRNSNSVERFCEQYARVTVLRSDKNLGVSAGRNYLIHNTEEEFLFFVDNDIVVKTDNWLEIIEDAIGRKPDAEVFSPRMFNVWEDRFLPYFSLDIIDNKMVYRYMAESECGPDTRVNCFLGGAAIVRRKLFERLGVYDEGMFVGFEDYELALRGIRTEPVFCAPVQGIVLFHDHVPVSRNTFDTDAVSARYDVSSHEDSIKRIRVKHGVEFFNDKGWRKWLEVQQRTVSPGKLFVTKLVAFAKKLKARICLQ